MDITIQNIKVADDDVCNIEDFELGQCNPCNVHPFLFHDHGFCIAVVFASNLQDALDIAVDNDKMNRYLTLDIGDERFSYLSNAGEPYDIESLGIIELKNPPMSFCALYAAAQ